MEGKFQFGGILRSDEFIEFAKKDFLVHFTHNIVEMDQIVVTDVGITFSNFDKILNCRYFLKKSLLEMMLNLHL